jgi:hypothetical protein
MEKFNILVVRPPDGSLFHHAYSGAAMVLGAALKRLGFPTRIAENEMIRDATNIVLGAQYLETELTDTLPPNTIIYNTEMILPSNPFLPTLVTFSKRFETWDYSERNMRIWRELGISQRVRWLQPGYVPECTTIDRATPTDIDALFYGQLNARRRAILDDLARHDVRTYVLQNRYGAARDAYIARAKIVLNIHATNDPVFEIARVSQVLSNHRLLVSESGGEDSVEDLLDGMAIGKASELAQLCRALLADDDRRKTTAERGFELFSRRDYVASVRSVLAERDHER